METYLVVSIRRAWMIVMLLSFSLVPGLADPDGEAQDVGTSSSSDPRMVLIPGGEFIMGHEGHSDFCPPHTVRVSPFSMDKFEVTNAQYLEFCEATERSLPEFWGMETYHSGPDFPNHPVVGVSWIDANAYARWRGARLPTEAEWEYAARGGLVGCRYSHGDSLDPTLYTASGVTGASAPSPVGTCPPNGYGLYDMTGNVSEWVKDWYDSDFYEITPVIDPTGPPIGRFRVIRGGGWHTGPYCRQVHYRNALPGNWRDINVGFRCVRSVGESAASIMEQTIREFDLERAVHEYQTMREAPSGTYYFDETEFNDVGYRLLAERMIDEAIEIFRINVEAFPLSANAEDSLGEAYREAGEVRLAIEHYTRSLELNRWNSGAAKALEELESD